MKLEKANWLILNLTCEKLTPPKKIDYVYNTLTTFHYSNIKGCFFLITNWFFSDEPVDSKAKT